MALHKEIWGEPAYRSADEIQAKSIERAEVLTDETKVQAMQAIQVDPDLAPKQMMAEMDL